MSLAFKIVELVKAKSKLTSGQIADRFGCHPAYVRAVLHRAGIFRRKHDPNVIYERSSGKYVRLEVAEYRRLLKAAGELTPPLRGGK
jgi:hypothetical protein